MVGIDGMPDHITDGEPDDYPIKCKSHDCDEVVREEDTYCPECWQCWQDAMRDSAEDR